MPSGIGELRICPNGVEIGLMLTFLQMLVAAGQPMGRWRRSSSSCAQPGHNALGSLFYAMVITSRGIG